MICYKYSIYNIILLWKNKLHREWQNCRMENERFREFFVKEINFIVFNLIKCKVTCKKFSLNCELISNISKQKYQIQHNFTN